MNHQLSTINDTIFALATPMGRSGVAIIRISGKDALTSLPHFGFKGIPQPRKAIYHHFTYPSGDALQPLDSGLLLYFPSPHSFTGEDSLEFQIHGSIAIIKKFLSLLASLPHFRMAEPGEFARRAFQHGKMDLTAAEGLSDLIEAETEWQRQHANFAAQGHVRKFYDTLRKEMVTSLALLEAYIDFPEEDIPEELNREIEAKIDVLINRIDSSLHQQISPEKIRDGFNVVILGAPNAGKSSLLNALSKRDAAIVSATAGTTRDLIEVHLDIEGIPVVLVDTAGIRETDDSIEREGINRAKSRAAKADIKLLLFEASGEPSPDLSSLQDNTSLWVRTKCDLNSSPPSEQEGVISLSINNEASLQKVLNQIKESLSDSLGGRDLKYFVRERHRNHLEAAIEELHLFKAESILELRCERLRLAAVEIGKITGAIEVDELLGVIFSTFCIGK